MNDVATFVLFFGSREARMSSESNALHPASWSAMARMVPSSNLPKTSGNRFAAISPDNAECEGCVMSQHSFAPLSLDWCSKSTSQTGRGFASALMGSSSMARSIIGAACERHELLRVRQRPRPSPDRYCWAACDAPRADS